MHKISTVIPTKNEALSIGEIIDKCKSHSDEIIVVDGHSSDDTCLIAKSKGVKVCYDNGKGKGDGIRTAIKMVSGDIIVLIDADHSHDPDEIPKLVAPIISGDYDHVTGSRMLGGSDELHGDIFQFIRLLGSSIITLGINYRFNVRLTDSQNGFRALKTSLANKLNLKENITSIEQEMIIKTLAAGYKMGEVASHEYARKHGQSRFNVGLVFYRYIYSWFKYLIIGNR